MRRRSRSLICRLARSRRCWTVAMIRMRIPTPITVTRVIARRVERKLPPELKSIFFMWPPSSKRDRSENGDSCGGGVLGGWVV